MRRRLVPGPKEVGGGWGTMQRGPEAALPGHAAGTRCPGPALLHRPGSSVGARLPASPRHRRAPRVGARSAPAARFRARTPATACPAAAGTPALAGWGGAHAGRRAVHAIRRAHVRRPWHNYALGLWLPASAKPGARHQAQPGTGSSSGSGSSSSSTLTATYSSCILARYTTPCAPSPSCTRLPSASAINCAAAGQAGGQTLRQAGRWAGAWVYMDATRRARALRTERG